MNIDYFIRKQELNLANITTKYIRVRYLDILNSNNKLIALIGARGVGKTTLLYQYIKLLDEKALYMSGDDVEFTNSKLYDLVDEFYTLGGRVVIVDEVHKYKNWSQEIKNVYDSFPDIKIRISGSSMLNILYEKYDLSRRVVIHQMNTLSFREYLELTKDIKLSTFTLDEILLNSSSISKELVFKHKDLYASFKEYLKYGAYPFFIEGVDSFDNKLYNAMDKIIYEDIPSLNRVDYTHISIFEKLIYFVTSSNKPFIINVAALFKKHFEYLNSYKKSDKDLISLSLSGNKMARNNLYIIVKNIFIHLGIEKQGLHIFRHHFGSTFAANNGNMKILQDLLGHSSSATTMIYSSTGEGAKERAISELGGFK